MLAGELLGLPIPDAGPVFATALVVHIGSGLTATSFTATGLTNGSSYYFKVAAVSALGTSADSAYVIGTPANPVQPSVPIVSMTTRGYMKRSSRKIDPPTNRCV